jgi:hypothetical protein
MKFPGGRHAEVALSEKWKNIGRTKFHCLILPGRRLFVVGSVRGIIIGLDLREPLHAGAVDLGDPVLEGGSFDVIFYCSLGRNVA